MYRLHTNMQTQVDAQAHQQAPKPEPQSLPNSQASQSRRRSSHSRHNGRTESPSARATATSTRRRSAGLEDHDDGASVVSGAMQYHSYVTTGSNTKTNTSNSNADATSNDLAADARCMTDLSPNLTVRRGQDQVDEDHHAGLVMITDTEEDLLPSLQALPSNSLGDSAASLDITSAHDSLRSLMSLEEPLGGEVFKEPYSGKRTSSSRKHKGDKGLLGAHGSSTSSMSYYSQEHLHASYNSHLSMVSVTEAETEHSSSGDEQPSFLWQENLFALVDHQEEANPEAVFCTLSQEAADAATIVSSSTAQAVVSPAMRPRAFSASSYSVKRPGKPSMKKSSLMSNAASDSKNDKLPNRAKTVDAAALRHRMEHTLALTSDDDEPHQYQRPRQNQPQEEQQKAMKDASASSQRKGRSSISNKNAASAAGTPMKDTSQRKRATMKDTSTKSANSQRKARSSMNDTSTKSASSQRKGRSSISKDQAPMMDWSNNNCNNNQGNEPEPLKDSSKKSSTSQRKRRSSTTAENKEPERLKDSISTGTESSASARRSATSSLRSKRMGSESIKDNSSNTMEGSSRQRRNRTTNVNLNDSKSSFTSSNSNSERRPRRTKTTESSKPILDSSSAGSSTNSKRGPRRIRTTEPVPAMKDISTATTTSERGRRSKKMDNSSNKDHRRRSPNNKRNANSKKKATPAIKRSNTTDAIFRGVPKASSYETNDTEESNTKAATSEVTKASTRASFSKKNNPVTRSRTGDAVLGRMAQMIKRVNSKSSRHQSSSVALPSTTTAATLSPSEVQGTPKRAFSTGMGILRRSRSKSWGSVSSSSISAHKRITVTPSTKRLNIFGSDIVSEEYILAQLDQVEEKSNIVVLELEDFLLARRDSLDIPEKLKSILACVDGRPWEGIIFVDELVDGFAYRGFKRNRKRFIKGMDGICAQQLIPSTYKTKINIALDNAEEEPTRLQHLVKLLEEFKKDPSVVGLNIRTSKTTPDLVRALRALLLCGRRQWEGVRLELGGISSNNTAIQSLQRAALAKEIELDLVCQA